MREFTLDGALSTTCDKVYDGFFRAVLCRVSLRTMEMSITVFQ